MNFNFILPNFHHDENMESFTNLDHEKKRFFKKIFSLENKIEEYIEEKLISIIGFIYYRRNKRIH